MADNSSENDQQKIDNAISELAERKNDYSNDRPSTSTAHKRPSPSAHESERIIKRHNSSQSNANETNNKFMNAQSSEQHATDDYDGNASSNNASESKDVEIVKEPTESNSDENVGISSRAIESPSECSFRPAPRTRHSAKPNASHLSNEFIKQMNAEWLAVDNFDSNQSESLKQINGNVKLFTKPFKICLIQEFLDNKELMEKMVGEMCQIEWQRKQMDLYEFHQTTDLTNISQSTKPALKRFYNMMNNTVLPWMKEITGLPLTRISASCSMYNYGDYLLVHDDLLSDRRIAFVYYLSPWCEQWTDEMGGALELFECDENTNQPKYPVTRKFPPRHNQFVFFHVCKQSFHQVGEVTNLVYPRLTINGWFHGPGSSSADDSEVNEDVSMTENEDENNSDFDSIQMYSPSDDELILTEWIDLSYLRRGTKTYIQQHIEDKSEVSLESFLIQDFFDLLLTEFRENTDLVWELEGPANQQKYETLRFSAHSTGPPKDLYTLFTSKSMFGLLHEYTELDFDGSNAKTPTCSVQICRFTQGCYTLLGSSSTYADCALEAILFFGAKDGVGKITYLSPSEDPNEYNTTADMEVTASSMDDIDVAGSSSSTIGNSSKANSKGSANKSVAKNKKAAAAAATTSSASKGVEIDTSVDDSVAGRDAQDAQDAEVKAIMCNVNAINTRASVKRMAAKGPAIKKEINSDDEDSVIGSAGTPYEESPMSEDEGEDGDCDFDELAQEESLLTIHPKDNSLNLVYRLSGQTKFIKYISKNALKPDEYVYILLATYKE